MQRIVAAMLISLSAGAAYGLRCWECAGATDDAHCKRIGKMRECLSNQDACEIEIREHAGWGGTVFLYKHCKQSRACDNNQIQNPRAASTPTQCNPDNFNSVCRCCCYEDECNAAEDACFDRTGCPPVPRNVPHGSVSCTRSYSIGSVCTVACDLNTQRTEPASTVCQDDGTWSNDLAQCLYMQCEARNVLEYGWYVCTNAQFPGSECTAFCRPGFTLIGEPVGTCMASTMTWDNPTPKCEGGKCPDRGAVAGGNVTCSDENNVQSGCRVECLDGRRMVGISFSYCEDAGTWSHELPECLEASCEPRGTILNGEVNCNLGNKAGSNCLATCDRGFVPNGNTQSVCLPSGFWSQPLPFCTTISCPPRGIMVGGVVTCTDRNEVGSVCRAECRGETLLIGEPISVCQRDGFWDRPLPTCRGALCPERNTLTNGRLSRGCETRTVGQICTAECVRGTRLVGDPTSICQAGGIWDKPLPTCRSILCPERNFLTNGKLSSGCITRTVDQACTATCDNGATLVGTRSALCQSDGRWSTPLPSCQRIFCIALDFSTQPGVMTCSDGYSFGSVCRFECNMGHRRVGPGDIRCTATSRWNEGMPKCERVSCPPRGNLIGGKVDCSDGTEIGSVCTAECSGQTRLVGTTRSVCQPDGSWNRPLPTCQSILCPERSVLINGKLSDGCKNPTVGQVCTATCNNGMTMVGAGTAICQPNGIWSEPLPSCRRTACPALDFSSQQGEMDCSDGFLIGSECRFECNQGYRLSGTQTTLCTSSSRWSERMPTCERLSCPPRGDLVGGGVQCTDGTEVGSVCTAECLPRNRLVGATTSVCQFDGTWDQPLSICRRVLCPERSFLNNGQLSDGCSIRTVGQVCTATCNDGTALKGVGSAVCQQNGEWSEPLPICERIVCTALDFSRQQGLMICSDRFFVGSVCRFECRQGYRRSGTQAIQCTSSSNWNGRMPTCERILCPPRGTIIGGSVDCSDGSEIRSVCTARCSRGTRPVGALTSVCQLDGTWDEPLPICQTILCPERSILINGRLSDGCQIRTVDQICTATCNDGMTMEGSASAVCQPDGEWSEPLPTCQRTVCPALDFSSQQGVMTCSDGFFVESVCSFECDAGYLRSGVQSVRCTSTSSWDESMPTCESVPCDDQGDLRFGTISCNNENEVGSTCSFQCLEDGFEVYPKDRGTNICLPNQNWSSPKPCCARPCPPYATMDIVFVLDSSSSIGIDNWILLKRFVEGVINSFIVAPEFAHFAIFRYNRRVDKRTQIFLDEYPGNVNGVIEALRTIPYDGSGTLTGRALEHALQESLSEANGNRPDVKDLVIVLTDGRAADDVKTPADALRDAGAEILVVGIENKRGDLDMQQLIYIAGREENVVVTEGGFAGLDEAFSTRLETTICLERCS